MEEEPEDVCGKNNVIEEIHNNNNSNNNNYASKNAMYTKNIEGKKQGRLTQNYMTRRNQHLFKLLRHNVTPFLSRRAKLFITKITLTQWFSLTVVVPFFCWMAHSFIHSFSFCYSVLNVMCVGIFLQRNREREREGESLLHPPSILLLSRISHFLSISIISIDAKPLFKHFY